MPFAALYIPNFPAQAVLRAEPALLREQTLAILEGAPPLIHVVAMNEAARAAGVELGMTRLQAQALPCLALRMRSHLAERAAHAALLDCAAAFSPRVEAIAQDTVVLDFHGLERLFGPPASIARELAQRAAALALEANIAVAGNMEAAIHAARGFAGMTIIADGKEAERLAALSVEVLIRAELAIEAAAEKSSQKTPPAANADALLETFDRWGVRTFHAFALLPTIAVAERLGQRGVAMQKLARGEGLRQLTPAVPELRFEEVLELEHPIENLESLAFALNRLLEQLCCRLEARALATNELRLRLELEDNRDRIAEVRKCETAKLKSIDDDQFCTSALSQFRSSLRLPLPMRDPRLFLKLWQLELNACPPQAPVTKIFLAAEPAPPRVAQRCLFSPLEPQPERLELMLARIAGIVGNGRAGSPELRDTHAPDAFAIEHFSAQKKEDLPRKRGVAEGTELLSCPLPNNPISLAFRRFCPPHAAAIELRAGVPVQVNCTAGPRGEITWAAGPWRNSGEWWNGSSTTGESVSETPAWSREEWDIRIGGAIYRLVRNLTSGAWSVDGVYD
jgi:protein ImuB